MFINFVWFLKFYFRCWALVLHSLLDMACLKFFMTPKLLSILQSQLEHSMHIEIQSLILFVKTCTFLFMIMKDELFTIGNMLWSYFLVMVLQTFIICIKKYLCIQINYSFKYSRTNVTFFKDWMKSKFLFSGMKKKNINNFKTKNLQADIALKRLLFQK